MASTMYGAKIQVSNVAAARTINVKVTTLEIDRHALRSPSSVMRWTKTERNVAPMTPPMTRS